MKVYTCTSISILVKLYVCDPIFLLRKTVRLYKNSVFSCHIAGLSSLKVPHFLDKTPDLVLI